MALHSVRSRYLQTGLLFATGVASIAGAWLLLIAAHDGPGRVIAVRALMAPLGLALLGLAIVAGSSGRRRRWANVLAAGLLLLLFSAFAILSFGMITLPVSVVLLVLATVKLLR